ncbi:MAG: EamA family transporter [Solirubrobacteraceae bacterium]
MTGIVLIAFSAAMLWGLADFGGGLAAKRTHVATVLLATQTVGLLVSVALVLVSGPRSPGAQAALASLGAGIAGAIGLAFFYRALATGSMSIVAPLAATGVALPVLVGMLGSGDGLHRSQAAGLALAVVGVVLASRQAEQRILLAGGTRSVRRRAVVLALLSAVGFGLYFTGAHAGVRGGGAAWMLLLSHASAVALIVPVALLARAPLLAAPELRAPLLLIALLDLSATGLYALANRHGLLSVVAVVGSLYPLATVALARFVLGERVSCVQGFGVVFALGGVGLLAGG